MTETKKPTPRNSTVAISPDVAKKLDRFCTSNGITKKDFLSLSLSYFERNGINPAEHESPAQEMQKLIKRIDQIVAFIKTQEKDLLRPLVASVSMTEERIKSDLETVAKNDLLKLILKNLDHNIDELQKEKKQLSDTIVKIQNHNDEQAKELKTALTAIAEFIDEKGKGGLLNKFKWGN